MKKSLVDILASCNILESSPSSVLKSCLRTYFLAERKRLAFDVPSVELGALQEALVYKNVSTGPLNELGKSVVLASYIAVKTEFNVNLKFEETRIFPAVTSNRELLWFYCDFETLRKGLPKKDFFGMPSFDESQWRPIESFLKNVSLLVVLTPCLAVDVKGTRLGYGGGFYDRLFAGMANINCRVLSVAVTHSRFVLDDLPKEITDFPVNAIVTEKEFLFL